MSGDTHTPLAFDVCTDEEARKQIERDASILKAKVKLEERGGAAKLDL